MKIEWAGGVLLTSLILLAGCGGGGLEGSQEPDPVVQDFGIAYVKRALPVDEQGGVQSEDVRDAVDFRPGGDLYFRPFADAGAPEVNVTGEITQGMGDVRDVTVSWDATRLLFALRLPEIEGADEEDQPTWNIWEYEIESGALRRVIASDTLAEEGQDISPRYLPDGRILFASTRQRRSRAILLDEGKPQFSALDEDLDNPALLLHVMRADGTEIRQISFNASHDLDPVVTPDGKVVFSRWDNMGGRNEISLYRMRPDGVGLELLYGAHSHASGSEGDLIQFMEPRTMPDGRLLVLARSFAGADLGGDLITVDVERFADDLSPIADWAGLAGPAQAPATRHAISTVEGPSPGGRFLSGFPLWDGTDRLLVSWTPCRLQDVDGNLLPCVEPWLSDPELTSAPPLYSLFVYDPLDGTQLPVVPPQEGVLYTDVVAAAPRPLPEVLLDLQPGEGLDPVWVDEGVGVLHIRSVYDLDGVFDPMGAPVSDLATMADPLQTPPDQRPARFLRVIKAVPMPDRDVVQVPGSAFGRSRGQLMREIVAYAPIEPDGSVMVKVPANVPLTLSVLDARGRRIGGRHQNWFQVQAGEKLECNGCHDHAAAEPLPHGRLDARPPLNGGAVVDGQPFPNANPALVAMAGESMAETRIRISCESDLCRALDGSPDPLFVDHWTDPETALPAPSFSLAYRDLRTPPPTSAACLDRWGATCRITIHYEIHIHPLWGVDRRVFDELGNLLEDRTCNTCHSPADAEGNAQVPAAQLDLADGPSDQEPDHFKSYRELMFPDNELELDENGLLVERMVQQVDGEGNPVFVTDEEGNLVLDPVTGEPIPVLVPVRARGPSMSTASASAGTFMATFDAGGAHEGWLEPAELRLIAEWLDIGGQYYNDPFAVPVD